MIIIHNRQGKKLGEALVDADDFHKKVKHYTWYLSTKGYAFTAVKIEGKWKYIQLHRFILNPPKNMQVDHINRNRLDCRRSNLRLCTPKENARNISKAGKRSYGKKQTTSKYRGVTYYANKGVNPWRGQVYINGKNKHIGWFETELKAAIAVEAFRKKHKLIF
jgi:hypothetical protein